MNADFAVGNATKRLSDGTIDVNAALSITSKLAAELVAKIAPLSQEFVRRLNVTRSSSTREKSYAEIAASEATSGSAHPLEQVHCFALVREPSLTPHQRSRKLLATGSRAQIASSFIRRCSVRDIASTGAKKPIDGTCVGVAGYTAFEAISRLIQVASSAFVAHYSRS